MKRDCKEVIGVPERIRIHFFFRKPRAGETYSLERLFDAIIKEIPTDRFDVRRITCPLDSKGIARRILLMLWAATQQGDLNHITGDISFIGILMQRRRTVQTIPDGRSLQRLTGFGRKAYELLWVRLPLYRAGRITAISEATRAEVEPYARTGAKIRVIPCCVTINISKCEQEGLPVPPRILQIGTMSNKNLERVIAALEGCVCVLVIIGPLSSHQRELLEKAKIVFENYVALSNLEIVEQYKQSTLLTFVSTYEGFGLPILEAQAVGRPVVTSDREPMKSVAGAGAICVSPEDVGEIKDAIREILSNKTKRNQLIDYGRENVANYTPSKIAKSYCALYQELLNERQG